MRLETTWKGALLGVAVWLALGFFMGHVDFHTSHAATIPGEIAFWIGYSLPGAVLGWLIYRYGIIGNESK